VRGGRAIVVLWVAACGGGAPRPRPPAACRPDPALIIEVWRQRADGYLAQALAAAEQMERRCSDPVTQRQLAEVLADLGLDRRAVALYRGLGDAAAVAELERRPPPARQASADEERQAMLLYRDGVDARLRGDHAVALRQLRRAYALRPHPLTIVQIGLVHKAAGEVVEHRKANARALAIAEDLAGAPARLVIRPSHQGRIRTVASSADGRWVLSTDDREVAMVWDAGSGRQAWTGTASAGQAGFADGGRVLACVEPDGLALWDTHSWTRERVAAPGVTSVAGAAAAPVVVSGDRNGRVTLWRAGVAAGGVAGCPTGIAELAVSSAGDLVGISCGGSGYRLWRPGQPEVTRIDAADARSEPAEYHVAVDPAGTYVVTAEHGQLRRWDAAGKALGTIALADGGDPLAVAVGGDGRIAIRLRDKLLVLDARGAVQRQLALEQEGFVGGLAFSADGQRLVTPTDRSAIRQWDVAAGTQLRALGGNAALTHIAVHPTGTQVAVGSSAGRVWRWDLRDGKRPFMFEGSDRALETTGLAFARGGDLLLIGHHLGVLAYDALANSIRKLDFEPTVFIVRAMAGGDSTLALGIGARLQVHRLEPKGALDGTQVAVSVSRQSDARSTPGSLALSPDQARIARVTGAGVVLWDVAGDREAGRIAQARGPVAFHPSLPRLAAVDITGGVGVWELDGTRAAHHELAYGNTVSALAFLPDGRLVAATEEGALALERPGTARLVVSTGAAITALAVDPRGAWLASTHRDGTMRLWSPDGGQLLATLLVSNDQTWLVSRGDRVTGTGDSDLLYWQAGPYQLPGFVGWQRNHAPDLLADLF
jgi:WD40 repeat protein